MINHDIFFSSGVTDQVDRNLLSQITRADNRVFLTPNFDTLQNEIIQVVQVTCGQGDRAIAPTPGESQFKDKCYYSHDSLPLVRN